MAKNVSLWGADYPNVPALDVPQTGGGTARFTDASVTTATASDVAQGKIFLVSDGTITIGTASGGGGGSVTQDQDGFIVLPATGGGGGGGSGLEHEEGTWSPTTDVYTYTIPLQNQHATPPAYYTISIDSDGALVTNAMYSVCYVNVEQITGNSIKYDDGTNYIDVYGYTFIAYQSSNNLGNLRMLLTTPSSSTASITTNDSRYWATPTSIKAYGNSSTRMWYASQTYKWNAVWI